MYFLISGSGIFFAGLINSLNFIQLPLQDLIISLLTTFFGSLLFINKEDYSKIIKFFNFFVLFIVIIIFLNNLDIFYTYFNPANFSGINRLNYIFNIPALLLSLSISFYLVIYDKTEIFIIRRYSILFISFFLIYLSSFLILDLKSNYLSNSLNLSVVLMPIINTIYGLGQPVDTISQYGYYSYYFFPFLKIFGTSVTSITSLFGFLFFICFISIYFFTLSFSKKPFFSILITCSCLFLALNFSSNWPAEIYYQFSPIRTLLPTLSIFALFFLIKLNKFSYFVLYTITNLLFLPWNLETGLVTFIASIGIILLVQFYEYLNNQINIRIFLLRLFSIFFILLLVSLFLLNYYNSITYSIYLFFEPLVTWSEKHSFLFTTKESESLFNLNFRSLHFYSHFFLLSILIYFFRNLFFHKKCNEETLIMIYIILVIIGLSSYGKNEFSAPRSLFLYPLLLIYFIKINFNFSLINKYLIKINHLIYFLLTLFVIMFFSSLFNSPNFKYTPNYLDLKFPYNSNKLLWEEKSHNSDKINFIVLGDLLSKHTPLRPLEIKNEWFVSNYINLSIKKSDKVFIASEDDYFYYMQLKISSPIRIVNWHHIPIYSHQKLILKNINLGVFDWIFYDESFMLLNIGDKEFINSFKQSLDQNYYLVKADSLTFDWHYPGWKKTHQQIWKRK